MSCKEEFIEIFKEKITRPGADALLNYLENKSDFFTAPASARPDAFRGENVAGAQNFSPGRGRGSAPAGTSQFPQLVTKILNIWSGF